MLYRICNSKKNTCLIPLLQVVSEEPPHILRASWCKTPEETTLSQASFKAILPQSAQKKKVLKFWILPENYFSTWAWRRQVLNVYGDIHRYMCTFLQQLLPAAAFLCLFWFPKPSSNLIAIMVVSLLTPCWFSFLWQILLLFLTSSFSPSSFHYPVQLFLVCRIHSTSGTAQTHILCRVIVGLSCIPYQCYSMYSKGSTTYDLSHRYGSWCDLPNMTIKEDKGLIRSSTWSPSHFLYSHDDSVLPSIIPKICHQYLIKETLENCTFDGCYLRVLRYKVLNLLE